MLQNCHNYFLFLQFYLEMSINQICEQENYLHGLFFQIPEASLLTDMC